MSEDEQIEELRSLVRQTDVNAFDILMVMIREYARRNPRVVQATDPCWVPVDRPLQAGAKIIVLQQRRLQKSTHGPQAALGEAE